MSHTVLEGGSAKLRRRERMYRNFMEFFSQAERTRRWKPMDDIPWELLEQRLTAEKAAEAAATGAREDTAIRLETFCGVELFIPDYTKAGICVSREVFGQAWFHLSWGYEESKHALVFREYLLRSGLRTPEEYQRYEENVLTKEWSMPFASNREMACYGALQEIATYLIYANQRDLYKRAGDPVLHRIFDLVARDEAAHATFYRKLMKFEFEEDPQGASEDLAHVISHFEMPGTQLVPDFYERLGVDGVGISKQAFLVKGILPTLRAFGMTRRDLLKAKHSRALRLNRQAGLAREEALEAETAATA